MRSRCAGVQCNTSSSDTAELGVCVIQHSVPMCHDLHKLTTALMQTIQAAVKTGRASPPPHCEDTLLMSARHQRHHFGLCMLQVTMVSQANQYPPGDALGMELHRKGHIGLLSTASTTACPADSCNRVSACQGLIFYKAAHRWLGLASKAMAISGAT